MVDLSDAIEYEQTDSNDSNAPSFGNEMPPSAFQSACREYAEWAVENYDTFSDVDLDKVAVQVSQKLKRAAGKAGKNRQRPPEYFMRFAYGAYEKWGWDKEIEETVRHELIHIRQYQVNGSGGHGLDFRRMADEVDAPRHCKQFTDYNWGIYCSECDEQVTGKYRKCKMTKNPGRYQSKCCQAKCYSEKL